MLDLGEVIVRISVQREFSDGDQRELLLRPDLGDIERIVFVGLGLLVRHDLDVHVPRRELALLDGVEQIANGVVGVGAGELVSLFSRQVLDALSGLEVELAVVSFALVVDELEGVRAVAVHEAVAVGCAAVAEQEHDLVRGLGSQGDEVPEHVGVFQMGLWVAFLGVNEAREEDGVADEENRRVVADDVPDALIGVEFDGEAAGIARSVSAAAFTA